MSIYKQKHNPILVTAFFKSYGIPKPEYEYVFHPTRKWRFDMAWVLNVAWIESGVGKEMGFHESGQTQLRVYLEVDGGIWIKGGHNRGAQMKKDWEKRNAATELGWRGLWCEPKDLMTKQTADLIRSALCLG